jgi:TPP-dependent pyruvate/acetoin dehydrogenase alpha subunit
VIRCSCIAWTSADRPIRNSGVRAADVGRAEPTDVGAEEQLRLLEAMLRIRAFETAANGLYRSAKMPGLTHL